MCGGQSWLLLYSTRLVEKLMAETAEDTLLNRYRVKHEVLTHISSDVYDVVTAGMQDVVEQGFAVLPKYRALIYYSGYSTRIRSCWMEK